ncbi:MAG: bifunctional diguanylate cyclase/phosphodiesterase [Selenomonadaceae bacterium]|nr:bifunctional diguanylate cyclase/phosphodiesterase [Selenomonadaceae bacterium]
MAMNKKSRRRLLALQRILIAGILLFSVSLSVILMFRDRLSLLLVSNVQTELLDITRQNSMYVDGKIAGIFSSMEYVARDLAWSKDGTARRVRYLTEINNFTRVGAVDIYGRGLDGPDIKLKDFPGIKLSLRGERKVVYTSRTAFDNLNAMVFSVPIQMSGYIMGSVYGILDVNALKTMFNFSAFDGNDESFIIDAEGRMFVQARKWELARYMDSYLVGWQQPDAAPELVRLYTKVRQNRYGVERIVMPDGSQYYLACRPLSSVSDLYVLDVIPTYVIQERITGILNSVTLILGIMLLLLLGGYGFSEWRQLKSQEKIYDLAYSDSLTELGNLEKYKLDLLEMLRKNLLKDLAVIVVNIRGMKAINDFMGYKYGNMVLKLVADRLKAGCREGENCYRSNSDMFYLVWRGCDRRELESRLRELLEGITEAYARKEGSRLYLTAGVYIVRLEDFASEEDKRRQEIASAVEGQLNINDVPVEYGGGAPEMDESWPMDVAGNARLAGKQIVQPNCNAVSFFDEKVVRKMKQEKSLEDGFQAAMQNGEFVVYFQPKYDVRGKSPVLSGAEALVRWISPEHGFLPPYIFLPLFERDGNLETLDRHVFELVCRQLAAWRQEGRQLVPVSVNISRRNIAQGRRFVEDIERTMAKYGIDKELIELEVLENDASVDEDTLITFLHAIKSSGFRIAMDDFGSGYSSLGLLYGMPIDCLKLDKGLFDGWQEDMSDSDTSLVRHIIQVAHETGRVVVAEGIEQKYQVELLRRFQCDYIQGYYFCKPIPAEDFVEFMEKERM